MKRHMNDPCHSCFRVQVEHEFSEFSLNPICLQFSEQVNKLAIFGQFTRLNLWLKFVKKYKLEVCYILVI